MSPLVALDGEAGGLGQLHLHFTQPRARRKQLPSLGIGVRVPLRPFGRELLPLPPALREEELGGGVVGEGVRERGRRAGQGEPRARSAEARWQRLAMRPVLPTEQRGRGSEAISAEPYAEEPLLEEVLAEVEHPLLRQAAPVHPLARHILRGARVCQGWHMEPCTLPLFCLCSFLGS